MAFSPDREELAWAAGFFDGEGCFSWTKKAAWGCAVIAQTNKQSLERFRLAVGGIGKIYGPYNFQHQDSWSRKAQWVFRVSRREPVQALAATLWFKLGDVKRAQAINVLSRYPRTCQRGHGLVRGPGCPRCVADAWAEKRLAKAAIKGQLTKP